MTHAMFLIRKNCLVYSYRSNVPADRFRKFTHRSLKLLYLNAMQQLATVISYVSLHLPPSLIYVLIICTSRAYVRQCTCYMQINGTKLAWRRSTLPTMLFLFVRNCKLIWHVRQIRALLDYFVVTSITDFFNRIIDPTGGCQNSQVEFCNWKRHECELVKAERK